MSSLEYIDTIIHKNAFINHLYEICKSYNNQYISCTIIGKYLHRNKLPKGQFFQENKLPKGQFFRRKFIVKKIYNKITQLINDNDIQFLTLCSAKDTFYVNLSLEHIEDAPLENIVNLPLGHAEDAPLENIVSPPLTLYTELDIIYLLYEYIIVNGFKKTRLLEINKFNFPGFTQNTFNILSDKLGDFYKKYDSVKQIIKSNKGIIFFIKKYANNLIFIEKITDTSFILYIEN